MIKAKVEDRRRDVNEVNMDLTEIGWINLDLLDDPYC